MLLLLLRRATAPQQENKEESVLVLLATDGRAVVSETCAIHRHPSRGRLESHRARPVCAAGLLRFYGTNAGRRAAGPRTGPRKL